MKVRMTESEYKKYLNYRKKQIRESLTGPAKLNELVNKEFNSEGALYSEIDGLRCRKIKLRHDYDMDDYLQGFLENHALGYDDSRRWFIFSYYDNNSEDEGTYAISFHYIGKGAIRTEDLVKV